MDEATVLAEISARQQTATSSDPDSGTRDRTLNPFEQTLKRVMSAPTVEPRKISPSELEQRELARREASIYAAMARLKHEAGKYAEKAVSNWQADTERQRTVREAVIEYCRSVDERIRNGEGVLLYGPVGTGKDHLAIGIAKAACLAGFSVRWLRGQEWFGSLRDAMDSDKTEREIFRSLACDLLVISDPLPPIGPLTQYQASMLYRLCEGRASRGEAIVATVNVSGDEEADARMGAQTWDRLKDKAWSIQCEWKSYRRPSRVV